MPLSTDIKPFSAADFAAQFNVSRETMDKLERYEAILRHWQARLNLVSTASLDAFWWRHAADSAQLLRFADEKTQNWLDIGSGAGFPGLIIALLAEGKIKVHLVERNRRKVAFLDTVIRETDAGAITHACPSLALIDAEPPLPAIDVVSARACAPLPKLLAMVAPFFNSSTEALLHRGKNWQEELTQARESWILNPEGHEFHESLTDTQSRILHIHAPLLPRKSGKQHN